MGGDSRFVADGDHHRLGDHPATEERGGRDSASDQKGSGSQLSISFDRILEVAKTVPQAEIASWDDIDRLDVRPSKGMVKVRGKNRWEVQIDTHSGEVLQVAVRRSDLIESIHDGSYFHDGFKLWVFLPAGLILVGLVMRGGITKPPRDGRSRGGPLPAESLAASRHAWQRGGMDAERIPTISV